MLRRIANIEHEMTMRRPAQLGAGDIATPARQTGMKPKQALFV